jgi:sugar phosphate isomerase/epimerase
MTNSAETLRVGCQTYTWEMLGPKWRGSPDDILDAVAAAGYAGVEFSNSMIGPYEDRPAAFQAALDRRGLACAAYAYATTGFADPACEPADFEGAQRALRLAAHFAVPLGLGGPSSPSHDGQQAKLSQACRFYRRVAAEAAKLGVTVAVHPHSHHTSLVASPEEYDRLLAETDGTGIMFNPDTGHLLRSGYDVMACFRKHRRRIVHVHLKDADAAGKWQPLGQGICDLATLLPWLRQTGYSGWVVAEEESDAVWADPARAIAVNRAALRKLGC